VNVACLGEFTVTEVFNVKTVAIGMESSDVRVEFGCSCGRNKAIAECGHAKAEDNITFTKLSVLPLWLGTVIDSVTNSAIFEQRMRAINVLTRLRNALEHIDVGWVCN